MQLNSKEEVRERIGLVLKGVVIGMLLLPYVLPLVDLYIFENLPDVSVEGEVDYLKKQEKPEEVSEFDWDNFVSIHQEDVKSMKERNKRILEAVVYLEAGPKDTNQVLVAEVIRNRTEHPDFPNDAIQVCEQKGQFETIQNGVPVKQSGEPIDLETIPEMDEVYQKVFEEDSNETERLLKQEALKNGLYNEKYWEGGALYFSNLEAVSEEVYVKGQYGRIKVSVKVGGNTYWRYWG